MTRQSATLFFVLLAAALAPEPARGQGNAQSGAQSYRVCTACHSLEPGVHLTGPSLAGLWGKPTASVEEFSRYSRALGSVDFEWDENSLGAWLTDPQAVAPGTYMVFDGIESDAQRDDLIAFLAIVMQPGGVETAIETGLISQEAAMGPVPPSLGDVGSDQTITAMRHCKDAYMVSTADGVETVYWEHNVRLKIDTSERGPGDQPVLLSSGMMGDRISIVFSGVDALTRSVAEQC
jgi:cytochrome c